MQVTITIEVGDQTMEHTIATDALRTMEGTYPDEARRARMALRDVARVADAALAALDPTEKGRADGP